MRKPAIAATLLVLLASTAGAAQTFDGQWQTTMSCPNARGALGYSFRFPSTVRAGVLHGEHGPQDAPASLRIDGPIDADGNARLYVTGHTGSREFVPGGRAAEGTEYGYNVAARFTATAGSGQRVEGRPCSFEFTRP